MKLRWIIFVTTLVFVTAAFSRVGHAQDEGGGQDDESKALDATATQWSFQFAHQGMPKYYDDEVNGQPADPIPA